ncbi:DNA repair protein [Marinobacteraceae bacterium S3BR75-40.1]
MQSSQEDHPAAIFFLEGGKVARQMRVSEFDAFLDGYVGLSDLADTDVQAVYVDLTPQLLIRALVFFRVYFDDRGMVDTSWNIPLQRLADNGAAGPDLGEGPIRLACKSQCPDPAQKDSLWDPDMSPSSNTFTAIRKAIEANSLKLPKAAPPEPEIPVLTPEVAPEPEKDAENEHRKKLAGLIRQQRLRIKTLQSAHRDQMRELNREHRLEVQGLNQEFQDMKQQLERFRLQTEQLKKRLGERNEQYLELQEQIRQIPEPGEDGEQEGASQAEMVLLQDQLDRKERELEMLNEQVRNLEGELEALRAAKPEEGSVMDNLEQQNVFLVAYHPGVGHITLPYDDIGRYFQNPQAYAAERCGISEKAYKEWLHHYENPVCQAGEKGQRCGEPLMRVSDPSEYREGIDNRCEKHQP